jgi:hypothetical protein
MSSVAPGEFNLGNNIIMPVWVCRGCGSTLVTTVARRVMNRRLICRYEYEEAVHIVLREDDSLAYLSK